MKLRNKKTRIIGELHFEPDKEYHFTVATEDPADMSIYRTLAEFNEEWEDYKPKEPLIKDERIRKIIRAWADENDSTRAVYYSPKNELADSYGNIISFNLIFKELNHGAEYTIAELCGKVEAPEPLEPTFVDLDERIREKEE